MGFVRKLPLATIKMNKLIKYVFLIILINLISCVSKSKEKDNSIFNQKIWLDNMELGDGLKQNPRAPMTNDLMNNHIKNGMSRTEIIDLLGQPFKDEIQERLPNDIHQPDSINLRSIIGESDEKRQKILTDYNNWYHQNLRPDTLLIYTVGWTMTDSIFLVVKLNDKNSVNEFWIEQN
tara:strand:- start:71 stop:604 length:534 start_codon:yes stop_codon:yes gene_type:complete